jgi:hypothetical protein
MRTDWIDNQSFAKYCGRWVLKVRKDFINGFEQFKWVPEVWIGDKLVINGNGCFTESHTQAMLQAENLLFELLASSNSDLTLTVF